jgi:hypothetical protein
MPNFQRKKRHDFQIRTLPGAGSLYGIRIDLRRADPMEAIGPDSSGNQSDPEAADQKYWLCSHSWTIAAYPDRLKQAIRPQGVDRTVRADTGLPKG